VNGAQREEFYPRQYATDGTLLADLRFALRHEPLDLGVIYAAFDDLGPRPVEEWVRSEPTGAFSRRAWFLYERLTGRTLDLGDAATGNYVDALDPGRHYVTAPVNSPRHRVRDNLMGGPDLCVTVRRTPRLDASAAAGFCEEARALTERFGAATIARAVGFLYTAETRSTFAIEGESASPDREERFFRALEGAATFEPTDKAALVALQNAIVDPRYAAGDWRDIQNFVGETTRRYGEYVHFISPRPEDVPALMRGWAEMTRRVVDSPDLDPVIAAAASAFAFVFVHPFDDGNGRIHRFLVHSILARRGFSPPGVILPVSAVILRRRPLYDRALEAFSRPRMAGLIDWRMGADGGVEVRNDTRDLYRFADLTTQAEFLYERIGEAIREDFKEELEFLVVFDAALSGVRRVVDMPDRKAQLFVRLCLQNGGRLSANKRRSFPELSDAEVARMEQSVASAMAAATDGA
jgi:hypothetical protein